MAVAVSPTASPPFVARAGGGDDGQREAEDRGEEVQGGDDEDHRLRAGDVDDQRPEQREPDREGRVEGQREDAVRGQQLAARDDLRDHRRLGRREEHGHRRHEDVEQQDQQRS